MMADNKGTSEQNFNLNDFLPHGVMLRDLLRDSQITEGDIKSILRSRGIYVQQSDKELTIPLLMNCLLSSNEFNLLRDKHFTREDSLKHKTVVIQLTSESSDLMSIIGRPKVELPKNVSYKLIKDPVFQRRNNGDELVAEFEIEKPNRSRDWSSHNTVHKGSITIRKEGTVVRITSEFTANEVRDLNDSLLRGIEQQFKNSGQVNPQNGITRITAGNLSNIQRIKFLLSFTDGSSDGFLRFEKIPYVSFGPDRTVKLPDNMGWMQDRVRALMIRGETQSSLHDLEFISGSDYQGFVVLESVDAVFSMEHRGNKFKCNLTYGFPKYLKTLNASIEFEVHVSNLSVHNSSGRRISLGDKQQREAEALVLKSFDITKLVNYEKILGEHA